MQYMRHQNNAPQQQYAPEEQNFSKLIERVDRMASEETKIMTFKSQGNGFLQPGGQDESRDISRIHEGERINQTNVHDQQRHQGQFEPTGTYDKRGSLNTLSQMTNPFRTGIYNPQAHG